MQPSGDERWRELAKRISQETDLDQMLKLVEQLNQEFEERQRQHLSQEPDSAEKVRQS